MALYDEEAVRKQLALMGFEDVPQELLHKFVARLRSQDAPAPQEADSMPRHPHNPPPMSPIAEEGSDIEQRCFIRSFTVCAHLFVSMYAQQRRIRLGRPEGVWCCQTADRCQVSLLLNSR